MTPGRSLVACALLTAACSSPDTSSIHSRLRDAGSGEDADAPQSEMDADSEPEPEPEQEAGGPALDAGASSETLDAEAAVASPEAATPAAEAGSAADATLEASTDAAVAASVLKSNCGAPINLDSAPHIATFPIMRSRPNGNIVVTWQELDTAAPVYRNVVRAFVGGTLGSPHTLVESGASRAEAAVDDQGNIHVHWAEGGVGLDREREDYNATTAMWSGKAQWFTNRGSEITLPLRMFSVDHAGVTLYTTFYVLNNSATAAVAVFDPLTSQWGALQPLEGAINNAGPEIPRAALNDAGQGVVMWGYTDNTTGKNLHSFRASTLAGGSFGAPAIAPGGTDFYDVVMLSGGDSLVVYSNTDRVSSRRFSPSAAPGSQWGEEQTVDMRQPGTPKLVVDAADRVTAVWAAGQQVRAARYVGGAWQPAADIGFTDLGFEVAVDASGNVSVVYGLSTVVRLRRLAAAGGEWTAAIDAAKEPGTTQSPMVAHDATGKVVVAYSLNRPLPQGGGSEGHIRWLFCE
jgi:hypothetical protein